MKARAKRQLAECIEQIRQSAAELRELEHEHEMNGEGGTPRHASDRAAILDVRATLLGATAFERLLSAKIDPACRYRIAGLLSTTASTLVSFAEVP